MSLLDGEDAVGDEADGIVPGRRRSAEDSFDPSCCNQEKGPSRVVGLFAKDIDDRLEPQRAFEVARCRESTVRAGGDDLLGTPVRAKPVAFSAERCEEEVTGADA